MKASEIKFGIEIETTVPSSETAYDVADRIAVGGYHNGIKQQWLPGSEPGTFWKCEADGSIRQCPSFGRDRTESACEFISPILKGAEGLANVVKTVETIKARGAKINSKCGIHITVSFPSNNAAALARLICLVANFEKGIFASTGTRKRETGIYCKPIKRFGDARKVADRTAYESPMHDRFHILNLTHLAAGYDRVEFRCFSGSLNVVKLVAWIRVVLGLVERALTTTRCTQWNSELKKAPFVVEKDGARQDGQTEVNRLMAHCLGWMKGWKKDQAGALGLDIMSLESSMKELRRMAKKYDDAASAPVAAY